MLKNFLEKMKQLKYMLFGHQIQILYIQFNSSNKKMEHILMFQQKQKKDMEQQILKLQLLKKIKKHQNGMYMMKMHKILQQET